MPTNALLAMFKNRLDDLDTAISGIETHLKKAKECGNDIPAKNERINCAITDVYAAGFVLSALRDFMPFIEGLTTSPTPLAPTPIPPIPPHALAKPQVNLCGRPDDSDTEG